MIYLVKIDEYGNKYLNQSFTTEKDMILYFANSAMTYTDANVASTCKYDEFLSDQNLTGHDIKRYAIRAVCGIDGEIYSEYDYFIRNNQLINDNGKIIDIRNYYDAIMACHYRLITDKSIFSKYRRHRHVRQGKTHYKKGKYEWCVSKSKLKADCIDYIDIEHEIPDRIHIKRRNLGNHSNFWNDKYRTSENNWKSVKVSKQYMWHKQPSNINNARQFKYCNADDIDTMYDEYDE